jgi:hypothetical protein
MARKKLIDTHRMGATAARGASWMSLLAAATLGVSGVNQLRARVSTGEHVGDGELRLIVQSYAKDKLDGHDLPREYAQPLASTQRSITAEELRNGVDVSVLQLPDDGVPGAAETDSVVVAWVEAGSANLDYDGLEARPHDGAYYGVAQRSDGAIELHLARSAA